MSKELFISSTPHETKVAIVEDDQLAEIYYERENEYTLAGSIYKGRVTRVLPGMQSAFVNIGLERDAFLYVSDFLLEEEEDVDGLDQVVSRGRVIESPGPDEASQGHQSPLEADELIPPAEQAEGIEGREPSAGESSPGAEATESSSAEEDRGGARKWRGRRRRRGGRGRFQEREERGSERPAEKSAESPAVEAAQPAQSESTAAVRAEAAPQPERSRGRGEDKPVLLPGESISKYQPHGAKPAEAPAPKPRTNAMRPSTEYSLNSAEFSPGSMVLPGESISK
ncbi:MAG TPA: ribonuclease, partial [Candidatus Angelobacter sp.]|nr:ribonuclease [Candidatus Angelobacter sp.]